MSLLSINRLFGSLARRQAFLRVAVVLATLALASYLAREPSAIYVFLPILIAGGVVLINNPPLGIVLLVISSLVVPFAMGTGTSTALNVSFLMVPVMGGIWLVDIYRRRSIELVPSRTFLPLIGLVITASISLLAGFMPWIIFAERAPIRAQIGAWGIFAFSAGAFILVANLIKSERWLRYLVWPFLGLGTLYLLSRSIPGGSFLTQYFERGATGSLFWIWITALGTGQALFNQELSKKIRFLLLLGPVLVFFVGLSPLARDWASGWFPALITFMTLVFLRWPRAGIFISILGILFVLFQYQVISNFLLSGDNAYSLLTRGAAYEIVLEIIRANPLLGVGPANYYYYTPLFPILGWYVRFNSHNQYVDLVAQTGLLGMLFFIWFAVEVGLLGWKLRNRFDFGFSKGYVYACLAGLTGTLAAGMLGDWFLPFVYNIGISGFRASVLGWVYLGGLVALWQIERNRAAIESD